jgi:hypothetical protein
MTEPQQTPKEFLEHLFYDEYCAECGGDVQHHQVTYALFDLPFAFCRFPPNEENGAFHPTILAFREKVP